MIPWLMKIAGWTAPWVALAFIVTGAVLMLGRRAGYWSPEALVGAELLLLSLQASSFVSNHEQADWSMALDGRDGGLIGWALGNLFVTALGQWVAVAFLGLLTLLGLVLLLCYTPLRYLLQILVYFFPGWQTAWNRFVQFWDSILPRPIVDDGPETWEVMEEAYDLDSDSHARHDLIDLPKSQFETQQKMDTRRTVDIPASVKLDHDESDNLVINASPRYKQRRNSEEERSPNESTSAKSKKSDNKKPKTDSPNSESKADTKKSPKPRPLRKKSDLPALDLLSSDSDSAGSIDVDWMKTMIEETLEDFNVPVKVVHVESGPTVTQFGVEPQFIERAGKKRKIRVNSIVNLADDLALALAAPSVRIEAPVPGRPYVGLEIPNTEKATVSMHGIVASKVMQKSDGALKLPLGRDTTGEPVLLDLARAPHLLIAGATGAGKSVCINTIVTGLLMQHGPESLNFIMVDPKTVELPGYNGIPHLLGRVITDMDQVMGALTWLLLEMDNRYQMFRELGVRHLEDYNSVVRQKKKQEKNKDEKHKPLPYIVLIIDELADLMMTSAEDIESQLCRLAQKARATGIHLIIATQRPSTDVVTIDSRVILDSPGAERLLGRGDMLMMRSDAAKLFRIQGCYVQDEEIEQIVGFWQQDESSKPKTRPTVAPWNSMLDRMDDQDEMIQDAMDLIRGKKTCSASMLQKALGISYPQASQLMEQLEKRKAVGPDQGSGRGRKVLIKQEEPQEVEEELQGELE